MKGKIKNVHVETNTCCNAKCIFCPTPKMNKRISMSKKLFYKIIDDLASFNFSGKVYPYLRNEPMTDPYIFERLKYLREKLPNATIFFSTNGLALNMDKIVKLLNLEPIIIKISLPRFSKDQCLKIMGIDNTKILKNINLLFEEGRKRNIDNSKDKFLLVMVNAPESEQILMRNYLSRRGMENFFDLQLWGLVNRGGSVGSIFGKRICHKKIKGCHQGSKEFNINNWFNILANGKVALCCMDWNVEVIFGNMNTQSIKEVWESKRYKEVLDMVFGKVETNKNFICKRC